MNILDFPYVGPTLAEPQSSMSKAWKAVVGSAPRVIPESSLIHEFVHRCMEKFPNYHPKLPKSYEIVLLSVRQDHT